MIMKWRLEGVITGNLGEKYKRLDSEWWAENTKEGKQPKYHVASLPGKRNQFKTHADDSGKVARSAAETSLFKKSLKTPIFNPSHPAYFL